MKLLDWEVGLDQPLFVIAGPCVIESRDFALRTAETLKTLMEGLDVPYIFKSSYDKANRTSSASFRGPGINDGLAILEEVRKEIGVPVLTDVHTLEEVSAAAAVVDVLQTPAFLCRQTDLIQAAAASGCWVNIKKGQFLSPLEMHNVVDKAHQAGGEGRVLVCERGTTFGYNNLVVDLRSLEIMRDSGCPVVFDATHSVQAPGGQGQSSGGNRQFVPLLARAAVAAGIAGIFMETHPDPDNALSDGPNSWPLDQFEALITTLKKLDETVRESRMIA